MALKPAPASERGQAEAPPIPPAKRELAAPRARLPLVPAWPLWLGLLTRWLHGLSASTAQAAHAHPLARTAQPQKAPLSTLPQSRLQQVTPQGHEHTFSEPHDVLISKPSKAQHPCCRQRVASPPPGGARPKEPMLQEECPGAEALVQKEAASSRAWACQLIVHSP